MSLHRDTPRSGGLRNWERFLKVLRSMDHHDSDEKLLAKSQ